MSVYGTPAPKRHHINIQGISPPSKRSSIGNKKANVTVRARRTSTDTGGQQIAQSIMNQIVNLTPLEQKHPMLDNAADEEFIKFKPAFENYKALKQINIIFTNGFKPSGLRQLVLDLGTESFHDTLSKLNTIYTDIIYQTSSRICVKSYIICT